MRASMFVCMSVLVKPKVPEMRKARTHQMGAGDCGEEEELRKASNRH